MHKQLRLALLGLVLVLVALVSALTAMRIAIHGREVEVPALIGLTPAEAESVLVDRGLRLELEDRFYSAATPEGRIISQLPAAGTVVRRGRRVRIAESLGSPRAKIPNVIGQSSRAAETNLRRRGLEVGRTAIAHLAGLPPGQVVAISPPPDTIASSPKVSLLLTSRQESETFHMPSLIGKKLADGGKAIHQCRLQLAGLKRVPQPAVATMSKHTILNQTPAAGSKVNPGTSVILEVSR